MRQLLLDLPAEKPQTLESFVIGANEELAQLLQRDVRAEVVARDTWETLLRAQGARNPMPRMRMVDGFNEGWICFEHDKVLKGNTTLLTVLRELSH